MKIAILNFDGAVASAVAGPYDMLSKVKMISETLKVRTKTFFDVDIVNSRFDTNQPFKI